MEINKILEIKIINKAFNIDALSRCIIVYQFEGIETIELKFNDIIIEQQTLILNNCFIKTGLVSIIGNEISKFKIEHNLSSLGEASVSFVENYFKKGFKVFVIGTAGYDKSSILYLYNFIKSASVSEFDLSITLLIDSKTFNLLFNDNENRILSFDNVSLNSEKSEFNLNKNR